MWQLQQAAMDVTDEWQYRTMEAAKAAYPESVGV
jgi:hypothetical protein